MGAEQVQVLEQGDGTLPEHLKAAVKEEQPKREKKPKKKEATKNAPGAAAIKVGAFAKKQAENKKKKDKKKNGKNKENGVKKEKGPSGPDLDRTRVSDTMITGEVLYMGRAFGWVKPLEEVTHEAATKHGGKIYLHKKDIAEGTEVKKGSMVTFHMYVDESGLGAEECS